MSINFLVGLKVVFSNNLNYIVLTTKVRFIIVAYTFTSLLLAMYVVNKFDFDFELAGI